MLALALTLVIISGGIDLSVGSIMALASVIVATIILKLEGSGGVQTANMWLACLVTIGLCGLIGAFTGVMVTRFHVPPFIVTHPTNVVLKEGLTATFRVVASGTPQLNYQWQRNAIDIPGATGDTLVIPGVTVTNAGAYRVLVSNLAGITNSLSATLIVEPGFQAVEIDTGITNVLTGASFINGLNGAIVGRDGSMRITRDGGATWNVVNTGMTNITDVQFVGGAIFIVGGGAHTICVSYDGGGTWDAAYTGPERIFRLRFLSPGQGYAVGDGSSSVGGAIFAIGATGQ